MSRFPTRVEDISPAWLSRALAEGHPGVEVAEVAVRERSSGTNSNARLAVSYRERAGAPESLFAKLPSLGPSQRELVRKSGMAGREAGFYRELANSVPMRVPRVYACEFDADSGDFVILVEDLVATSCTFPVADEAFGLEVARRAVEDLAALHLASSSDGPLVERSAWVGPQIRLREYGAGMLDLALAQCREGMDDAFAKVAELYIERHDAVHDLWEQGAWSIIHGDCHWGNLFLDHGRIGFLDWGCMARMPGMREVGYFLCMGLGVEERRRHERELIQHYLDCVAAGDGPRMSFDEAWSLYRLHAGYTVPASAPASIYRLLEDKVAFDAGIAAEFMRRSSAAVGDLEAYDALASRV